MVGQVLSAGIMHTKVSGFGEAAASQKVDDLLAVAMVE